MSLVQRFWLTLSAALLVAVLLLCLFGDRLVAGVARPVPSSGSDRVRAGGGVGDPYLPDAGGAGYDVVNYHVRVNATALDAELRGSATITAVARQDFDEFHLDLYPTAHSVTVNGAPATFTQRADDLAVTVARTDAGAPAVAAGSSFMVVVAYQGDPDDALPGTRAYYRAGKEFVIAGEPAGASLWYPANDHPRDPATMEFEITVPRGRQAIAAGRLIEHGPAADQPDADRWLWKVDAPTVTYATFLAVGDYRIERGTAEGRPFTYAVSTRLSADAQTKALRWLRQTPAAVRELETYLGPYPFTAVGGFVPGMGMSWGGLETAMNPVYDPRLVGEESLLNHELAHMWFGDTVTLTEWNDLFNNESLASYAEWLTTGTSSPAKNFDRNYRGQAKNPEFWGPPLSDPGLSALFVRVYDRGPTAVHALRTRMGDDVFFAFLRSWAQQSGPRSLEDFRRAADDASTEDLTGFFAEWLDQTDRPEPTAANGVPPR